MNQTRKVKSTYTIRVLLAKINLTENKEEYITPYVVSDSFTKENPIEFSIVITVTNKEITNTYGLVYILSSGKITLKYKKAIPSSLNNSIIDDEDLIYNIMCNIVNRLVISDIHEHIDIPKESKFRSVKNDFLFYNSDFYEPLEFVIKI